MPTNPTTATCILRPTLQASLGRIRQEDALEDLERIPRKQNVIIARNVIQYLGLAAGMDKGFNVMNDYIRTAAAKLNYGGLLILGTADTAEGFFPKVILPALQQARFQAVSEVLVPHGEIILPEETVRMMGKYAPPYGKFSGPIVFEKR